MVRPHGARLFGEKGQLVQGPRRSLFRLVMEYPHGLCCSPYIFTFTFTQDLLLTFSSSVMKTSDYILVPTGNSTAHMDYEDKSELHLNNLKSKTILSQYI